MKAEVYYIIESAGGDKHRIDSKEEAKKKWQQVVDAYDRWCRKREDPDCPNYGWIPSLRHEHILTEDDYRLTGDFHYWFECSKDGKDVVEHLHHRLTTHVEILNAA